MHPFNILLAESSGQSCSDDRSHNLKSMLETSALGSHLRVHSLCLDRLHSVSYEPDLVVLRFGPATLLAWKSLIEKPQGWKDAKLIGAFCGNTSSQNIAQFLEWGLADYVLCPWREADIIPRLERLLPSCKGNQVSSHSDEAQKSRLCVDSLIGVSPCFLRQLKQIPLLARAEATVLIMGETGTGKKFSLEQSITTARVVGSRLFPSTVERYRINCLKVNYSATQRGHLRMRLRDNLG